MNNFNSVLRTDVKLAEIASKIVIKVVRGNLNKTSTLNKNRRKEEIGILFSIFRKKIEEKRIIIPNSNRELYNDLIRPWFFKQVNKAR